ncbi:hypothetical protein GRF29_112g1414914, partial [Pseudopithomyces chartarum]
MGAGTGKFTELLASRPEGYEIVAGEPHDQMRGVLEGKKLRGTTVVGDFAGGLESVGDGWADAVVVAQAFHWFATVETLREVRRVLRPEGGLGLIWNVDDFNGPIDHTPSTPYEARLKAIIRSLPNPINLYRELKWKDALNPDQQNYFKHPLGEGEIAYEAILSRESIWERFATMSQVSKLKGSELQTLKDRVFDALYGEDVEEDVAGNLSYHGRTVWYWTFLDSATRLRDLREAIASLHSTITSNIKLRRVTCAPHLTAGPQFFAGTKDGNSAFLDYASGQSNLLPPNKQKIQLNDIRTLEPQPTIQTRGFQNTSFTPSIQEQDFLTPDSTPSTNPAISTYYTECSHLVQRLTGATQVIPFHHRYRQQKNPPPAAAEQVKTYTTTPVPDIHIDNDASTAHAHLTRILDSSTASHWESRHWAIINVWKPLAAVHQMPLALLDPS